MAFYIAPATKSTLFDDDMFSLFPMKRQRTCHAFNPFEELAMLTDLPERNFQRRRRCPHPLAQTRKEEGFTAAIPVEGFRPFEVTTKVDKETRTVKVSGYSEQKNEEGTVVSKRQFERSFTLPEHCNIDALKSRRMEHGVLKFTAPPVNKSPTVENKAEEDKPVLQEKTHEEINMDVEKDQETPEESLFDAEINTEDNLSIKVNVGAEIEPSDLFLEVSPKTGKLTVKANGNLRSFTIPEKFDMDKMESWYLVEGILNITAPLKTVEKEQKTSIPINMTS